jgi:3-(methylthio)propionyl---CoA ligase
MEGLMMGTGLLISSLIRNADRNHGTTEIVTRTVEGPIHRYTYHDAHSRSRQLANALGTLGIKPGDRCATLAWNTHRHFEIYYAVSGMGAVCHTVNPRLFAPQISFILNHASDRCIFADLTFAPLLEEMADDFRHVEAIVIMTDDEHMPKTSLPNVHCYESLINGHSDEYDWPEFDENTASSLCYTSGTTGDPKGVLYSHRSSLIHALRCALPDCFNLSARDAILPVVPMFHVNAWGLPYVAAMIGSKLVFPGPAMDGASLQQLIEDENVSFSAGVPTIWLALLQYLEETGKSIDALKRVVIGGSATPKSMIQDFAEKHDSEVLHAWGMTEMSPIGTVNHPKYGMEDESREAAYDRQVKQGREVFGAEMKIVDDDDRVLPNDGKAFGTLKVRGPSVCRAYYNEQRSDAHDANGWFATGDVATIDPDGYMQITDRSKDVIKSGGEWISSIELENIAVGHPDVAEAATIGVHHPKWDERPLLLVIARDGCNLTREDMLEYFDGKVAKWWTPDDVVFVDELPHTATGKLLKIKLREDFKDYVLPTAQQS